MRSLALPRWGLFVLVTVGAAGVLAFWGVGLGAGLVDDAYIFMRYADNIARGYGPVFNPGERVEGVTSPAWTLLLALAVPLGHVDGAAWLLGGAAGGALGLVVVWALTSPDAPPDDPCVIVTLALGLVSLPAIVFWSFSGMDHPLLTLLVAVALVSGLADTDTQSVSLRTAAVLALAMVTRPEGVLLAAWIGGFATILHGRLDRHWWRRIAMPLGLASTAPFIIHASRFVYFGSLLPNTYYAKITPDTWDRLARGAAYLRLCLLAHLPLVVVAAALAVAARRLRRLPAVEILFLGGWMVLWIIYLQYEGGDHFALFRFFLPALPALVILIGLLWRALLPRTRPRWRVAFRVALAGAFVLTIAAGLAIDGRRAQREPLLAAAWGKTGRWIAAHTAADTLVATDVIGAIGYYGRRRTVDMLGLIDPIVARQGSVYPDAMPGHGRYHTDYIYTRAPDLVVYPASGRFAARPFVADGLPPLWHFSIIDFVNDRRCVERYEHISVALPDTTWIEMQKKKGFVFDAPYAIQPPDP